MLIYELIERKNNTSIYKYYPEGNTSYPGVVSVTQNGSDISGEIIELSPIDEFKTYAYQAIYGKKYVESKGTIAWY